MWITHTSIHTYIYIHSWLSPQPCGCHPQPCGCHPQPWGLVWVCVSIRCVRACVHVSVRACKRACVCVYVGGCVCSCVSGHMFVCVRAYWCVHTVCVQTGGVVHCTVYITYINVFIKKKIYRAHGSANDVNNVHPPRHIDGEVTDFSTCFTSPSPTG